MAPKAGLRFGRYELLDKLGAGGMGEVYRARDLDLGRDVAVKFLPQRFASDPDRLARFANEARAASSLNHPNIVTIHEIGQADGLPCIVMECVEGQTLRRLLDGRPLPPKRILELSAQVADGLAKAHGAGIVHRDLKPENLMVTPDGFVKILDFGLAKLRGPNPVGQGTVGSDEVTGLGVSPNTTAGVIIGTANYMSPEQASGRAVDYRSDQFALGAIIYEMAANRQPFRRPSAAQTLSAIIEEEPEPLASLSPSLPAPARWVVERCLAKDPADRYTSTADLARELRNVRDHLSEVSASSASGTVPARPGRARLWRTLGVGALALLTVLAFPMLRGRVRDVFRPPLPAEKRIAVLPFRCLGDLRESQPVCDGLVEYLVARLGQIERYQRSAWVVPVSEVREGGVESIDAARRALGATLAVSGSVQREGDRTVITAALSDATQGRQLRATTVEFPTGTSPLLDRTVRAIIDMLELELGPEAREMLRAGGTDVAEASDLYAQAVGYVPYSQARTALERYEQRPNLERAIELFQQALERDPDYALAHAGLGEAYWRLSRATGNDAHVALASEHAARALALDATLASAWVTQGIIHAGRGSAEEAVQDFQRALERNPRNASAYRELAAAYARLERTDDAISTYRKAIELQPESWTSHNYFGGFLLRQGRHAEAEVEYTKALELAPDNARVWSNLGGAYYFQEKFADAEAAWQRSIALLPTPAAVANLGTRQFFEGRYADAARTFEKATADGGRDYRVWRNLASAYYWTPGERERAADAYRRAAELAERERGINPSDAGVSADLADCYAMLGQADKARALITEAAPAGRQQHVVARSIGETYEQLGDRGAALHWLGIALALGASRAEIEQAPALARLRQDPGYGAVINKAGGDGPQAR